MVEQPAPTALRPLPGHRLDPGHADTLGFTQVQKTNQTGLSSRDPAQCGWPCPRLRTVPEVAQPFLKQRCGPKVGYGARVDEQILEH